MQKDSCGLTFCSNVATPTMDCIAACGITQGELGEGFRTQLKELTPFFDACGRVRRKDVHSRMGDPIQTRQQVLNPLESQEWGLTLVVSEDHSHLTLTNWWSKAFKAEPRRAPLECLGSGARSGTNLCQTRTSPGDTGTKGHCQG